MVESLVDMKAPGEEGDGSWVSSAKSKWREILFIVIGSVLGLSVGIYIYFVAKKAVAEAVSLSPQDIEMESDLEAGLVNNEATDRFSFRNFDDDYEDDLSLAGLGG